MQDFHVKIKDEYIKLNQMIKLAMGVSGGEADNLIREGRVSVNGETECRRGRKLYPGDSVSCEGEVFFAD